MTVETLQNIICRPPFAAYRKYMTRTEEQLRIDKWLWAARFFKTRGLAAKAVSGGKVHLNGERVKSAKGLRIGDELSITRGSETYRITVLALSARRGPAKEAATLYEESEESIREREARKEQRRIERAARPYSIRKPDKRERRQILRFTGKKT